MCLVYMSNLLLSTNSVNEYRGIPDGVRWLKSGDTLKQIAEMGGMVVTRKYLNKTGAILKSLNQTAGESPVFMLPCACLIG